MKIMHILAAALLACAMTPARAAEFYEGKVATIIVGFTPGGTYDQMARLYARHMPRFLPGKPTIVVQNMPGAGSLVATTHLANTAVRDGTVLGVVGGGTVWESILGNPQARYDPKTFNWIGGKSRDNITCLVWHTSPIRTIADAMASEVIVGATGPGSRTMTFPKALNDLVGTKFKIVAGYPGGNEITMALEKGEVGGYCGWALGSLKQRAPQWYDEKKVRFLVQFASARDKDLLDVPLAVDLAKTPAHRDIMEFLTSDAVLAWTNVSPCCARPSRRCCAIPPCWQRPSARSWKSTRCRALNCRRSSSGLHARRPRHWRRSSRSMAANDQPRGVKLSASASSHARLNRLSCVPEMSSPGARRG